VLSELEIATLTANLRANQRTRTTFRIGKVSGGTISLY
jgi:hypothetical protein